ASPANIHAEIEAGCPIVVGTTGWYEKRAEIEKFASQRKGAVLIAPNFSVGVAAFADILATAARALKRAPGFDAHITETHHSAKKDAPSGTAANLEKLAAKEWGRGIPITSIRTGSVPGTHEVLFDAPFEQIRIEHVARDRRVFADGGLLAAQCSNDTEKAVTMSKEMKAAGATHLLHVSPMYNKPPQRGIVEHFKRIAGATDLPIIVYNVPGRTGGNIEAKTTLALAQVKNIVAVKEASGNLGQITDILKDRLSHFAVLSGDDEMT